MAIRRDEIAAAAESMMQSMFADPQRIGPQMCCCGLSIGTQRRPLSKLSSRCDASERIRQQGNGSMSAKRIAPTVSRRSRKRRQTNKDLRAALKRYGMHLWNCPKNFGPGDNPKCTCGFDKALTS